MSSALNNFLNKMLHSGSCEEEINMDEWIKRANARGSLDFELGMEYVKGPDYGAFNNFSFEETIYSQTMNILGYIVQSKWVQDKYDFMIDNWVPQWNYKVYKDIDAAVEAIKHFNIQWKQPNNLGFYEYYRIQPVYVDGNVNTKRIYG